MLALSLLGTMFLGERWVTFGIIPFGITWAFLFFGRSRGRSRPVIHSRRQDALPIALLMVTTGIAFAVIAYIGWPNGVPQVGDAGILIRRNHYYFTYAGVPHEVERWQFVTVALIFHVLWVGYVTGFAVFEFFLRHPNDSLPRPPNKRLDRSARIGD